LMLHRRKGLRTNLIKNMMLNLRRNVAEIQEICVRDIIQNFEWETLDGCL